MDPDLRLLGNLPDEVGKGLASVVDAVIAGGAPEPAWIAVENETDDWVTLAAGYRASERVRGVIAASSEEALIKAHRLGIGGAMWLPPSSVGATEAFAAAASSVGPAGGHDAALVELMEDSTAAAILGFADRRFWRVQLGESRLIALLADLAAALETTAAILPWPALIVAGKDPDEVIEAWRALTPDVDRVIPEIVVRSPLDGAFGEGLLVSAYRALLDDRSPVPTAAETNRLSLPVHELPRGLRVGWWQRHPDTALPEEGWCASPIEVFHSRCRWRLDAENGSGIVEEVLTGEELDRTGEAVAVRLPGWASRDIRPGSPAGLLVARLAEAAARRGLPLWIPNLDSDALRLALGLPGILWVDGPAVPRT